MAHLYEGERTTRPNRLCLLVKGNLRFLTLGFSVSVNAEESFRWLFGSNGEKGNFDFTSVRLFQ